MTPSFGRPLVLAVLLSVGIDGLSGRASDDPTRAKTLTVEQATALAQRKGGLRLAVTELTSADVAAVLAGFTGDLRLESLAALTPEAAAALATRAGDLDLPKLAQLTPAVAQALAAHKHHLFLRAVKDLTPDVAEALATHSGKLHLGVTELSDAAAAALAKHGGSLALGSLQTLTSLPLAERLGRQEWVSLGVTRLTPEIATALCPPSNREKFKNHVQFNIAITELPADVAAAIMAGRGHISANSLESISDEAAAAWAGPFANIRLFGLKTLSPAAAASLAKGSGIFDIRSFGPELSDETAAALAKQMQTSPSRMVDLNGLKKLSCPALAVAALRRYGHGPHSTLNGVSEITPEVAAALAECKENLNPLPGLTALTSAPLAAKYAAQPADLVFRKLATIPDDVAAALATHKGKIELSGLREISDAAAQSLAKASGPVVLTALEKAAPAAITALRSNATIALPAALVAP